MSKMKRSKAREGSHRLATLRNQYHPFAEYHKLYGSELKRLSNNHASKFHKLASKIENTLPRGMRDKNIDEFSTTHMIIEVDHDEQMKLK